MALARFLTDTIDTFRAAEVESDTGYVSDQYTARLTGVRASVQGVQGDYRVLAQGEVIEQARNVFVAAGTDIIEDDILKHGGVYYRVVSVATVLNHHMELFARRVPEPTIV